MPKSSILRNVIPGRSTPRNSTPKSFTSSGISSHQVTIHAQGDETFMNPVALGRQYSYVEEIDESQTDIGEHYAANWKTLLDSMLTGNV